MNTIVTSKEEILEKSRELVLKSGWETLNIRSLAKACDVSIGSIYYYYNSKTDLVGATIESFWHDILHGSKNFKEFNNIQDFVIWIYERLKLGNKNYPGFFAYHSLLFLQKDKSDGKQLMLKTWNHILNGLIYVLQNDKNIKSNTFDVNFSIDKYADFLFSYIISSIIKQDFDVSMILEIIKRTLY